MNGSLLALVLVLATLGLIGIVALQIKRRANTRFQLPQGRNASNVGGLLLLLIVALLVTPLINAASLEFEIFQIEAKIQRFRITTLPTGSRTRASAGLFWRSFLCRHVLLDGS